MILQRLGLTDAGGKRDPSKFKQLRDLDSVNARLHLGGALPIRPLEGGLFLM
jgi:hypothetical protein